MEDPSPLPVLSFAPSRLTPGHTLTFTFRVSTPELDQLTFPVGGIADGPRGFGPCNEEPAAPPQVGTRPTYSQDWALTGFATGFDGREAVSFTRSGRFAADMQVVTVPGAVPVTAASMEFELHTHNGTTRQSAPVFRNCGSGIVPPSQFQYEPLVPPPPPVVDPPDPPDYTACIPVDLNRLTFVQGYLVGTTPIDGAVECGDGTPFPMLVNNAQLTEVTYLVRDAEYVSGESVFRDYSYGAGEYLEATVTFTGTPGETLTEIESTPNPDPPFDTTYSTRTTSRAYSTARRVGSSGDDPPMEHITGITPLGAAYDLTYYGLDIIGLPFTPTPIWSEKLLKGRDAVTESAMQVPRHAGSEEIGRFELMEGYGAEEFRTGFSVVSGATVLAESPAVYGVTVSTNSSSGGSTTGGNCDVALEFSGEVAWIDADGSGDPLSAGNPKYLGIVFNVAGDFHASSYGVFVSTSQATGAEAPTGKFIKLVLSDSTVTAQLFGFAPGGGDGSGYYSTTDWTFRAIRWWGYPDCDLVSYDPLTGLPVT